MLFRTLLKNFNRMLEVRGIFVTEYSELLDLSEDELENRMSNMTDQLDADFKTIGGNHSSLSLTRVVNVDTSKLKFNIGTEGPAKILIFFDSYSGKSITSPELEKIFKIAMNRKIDHIIYVSMFDRGVSERSKKTLKHIEFFTYKDFVFEYGKHFITPVDTKLITYKKFIEDNPDMEGLSIPIISRNDMQVRYYGGNPGEVLMSENEFYVPLLSITTAISYRIISSVDDDVDKHDASFFGDKSKIKMFV